MSDGAGEHCRGVVVADARDAAARAGLRAGDRIIDLNGRVNLDDADAWAKEELLIGNYPRRKDERGITLRPWETRVYRRA